MRVNAKDFGRRLKRARFAAGYITQADLAEAVGVDRSTVGAWESGRQYPQRYIGQLENLLGSLEERQPAPHLDPRLLARVSQLTPAERAWLIEWLLQAVARNGDPHAAAEESP